MDWLCLLSLVSGFLFGAVSVSQVLRTDPYDVVKSGSVGPIGGVAGWRITALEVLLAMQIAICAVLVTSSMVAVRGLVRFLHDHFGFEPKNALLVHARSAHGRLQLGSSAPHAKAHDRCRRGDSWSRVCGTQPMRCSSTTRTPRMSLAIEAIDLRPSNAAASAFMYHISPEYLHAEGTTLLFRSGFHLA